MALYVRHAAWLNAVPKLPEGDKSPRRTRRESLEGEGVTPDMPLLDWGDYLVQYLFEFGPTAATGMGSVPVPPPFIESWQRQSGRILQPWEFSLLLRLTNEYAVEVSLAVEPDRPPPFAESRDAARLHAARMAKNLDAFLE